MRWTVSIDAGLHRPITLSVSGPRDEAAAKRAAINAVNMPGLDESSATVINRPNTNTGASANEDVHKQGDGDG